MSRLPVSMIRVTCVNIEEKAFRKIACIQLHLEALSPRLYPHHLIVAASSNF